MRNIPPALKAHIDSGCTTLCRLLKITLEDGREFGITTLDRNVEFQGVTYYAQNGFDPSIIATDTSLGVDNAEGYSLYSVDVPGITAEMAQRGELDNAEWVMYLVNYKDLSMGAVVLDAGDIGEVRTVRDTVFVPELLSYAMRLRQSIGHVDSRTCRAVFGTDPNSQTGCGVNADSMWVSASVAAVSTDEPKVTFIADDVSAVPTTPATWRVRWISGDNVSSRLYQVEAMDAGSGQITLIEPLPFVVQIGDQFEIRPDCDKWFETCRDVYSNEINFKGENLIPVGQASDTPGAGIPSPVGSSGDIEP
ncbi:DUF2163 domain-containing protein [Microbulbifer thermotolerans]|uniref:DUF2163 domain-containing protein n=1 Tax=Microbulbifer thermotolerans TaxID=252514 RepID=UPI0026741597|nr:DUF2163 domain-containing protein [Microbulbifer thermotolerans]WKT59101.1 DUF2163 domain-containing protein [Microbulbifer thermotolerans]